MGPTLSLEAFQLLMKFRALGMNPPRQWRAWKNRQGFSPEEIELARKNWRLLTALLNPVTGTNPKWRARDEEWMEPLLRILDSEWRLATRVWKKKIPAGEPIRYALAKLAYLYGVLPQDWEIDLNEFMRKIK